MTKITTLADLQERANINLNPNGLECFILLGGGLIKSSKQIWYYPEEDRYDVHNDIDDTDLEEIYLDTLEQETNIIEALNKGALFTY